MSKNKCEREKLLRSIETCFAKNVSPVTNSVESILSIFKCISDFIAFYADHWYTT